jgi:hypothetical protein
MGIFDKIFKRRKRCSICGAQLLSSNETWALKKETATRIMDQGESFGDLLDDKVFQELSSRTIDFVCDNCGAVVCMGCQLGRSLECPKCGTICYDDEKLEEIKRINRENWERAQHIREQRMSAGKRLESEDRKETKTKNE